MTAAADGTLAATTEVSYPAGTQIQYNNGVKSLLNADPQDNDTVQAEVTSGNAVAYGSIINNASGDPTYVPEILALADIRVHFAGVDFGDNGSISVPDANHDGVLDHAIDVQTGTWPIAFRVVSQEKYDAWLADAKKKFPAAPSAISVADAAATAVRQ